MTRIIHVFGSNEAGNHKRGAALTCWQKYGAILGQGVGLMGDCWGIPTKTGVGPHAGEIIPLLRVKDYVDQLILFMRAHPDLEFDIWEIGCGLAKPCIVGETTGYGCNHPECRTARVADIASLFAEALPLANARLPQSFVNYLNGRSTDNMEDEHHD